MTLCLAIGAGVEQRPVIQAARELGLTVAAFDRDPAAPGLSDANDPRVIDIADTDAIVAAARELGVKAVLPTPIGRSLSTVAAVNEALGLCGVRPDAVNACTDKRQFHLLAADVGLRPIASTLVHDPTTARAAAHKLAYPVILKPRFGSGSRLVRLCADVAELNEALTAIDQCEFSDGLILEEAFAGREYGVDACIVGDHYQPLAIRGKELTPPPWRQELIYVVPSELAAEQASSLHRATARLASAMGLRDCFINADVLLSDGDRICIVEIAARPAGQEVGTSIWPLLYGVSPLSRMIEVMIGRRSSLDLPPPAAAVALGFLPLRAGRVLDIRGLDLAASVPGIIRLTCPVRPGDVLAPLTDGRSAQSRGFAIAAATTPRAARQALATALAAVEIDVSPEPVGR